VEGRGIGDFERRLGTTSSVRAQESQGGDLKGKGGKTAYDHTDQK